MADRQVLGTNTFEEFRVEFNELATDVGDIARYYWCDWYYCISN